jgi:hypothetical protein
VVLAYRTGAAPYSPKIATNSSFGGDAEPAELLMRQEEADNALLRFKHDHSLAEA